MGCVSQSSMNLVVTGIWIELEDIVWVAIIANVSLSSATVVGIVAYVGYWVVPSKTSFHLWLLVSFCDDRMQMVPPKARL